MSNKVIEFLVEQAGILLIAVFTGGAGAALEGAAAASGDGGGRADGWCGRPTAAAAAEAAGAAAETAEVAGTVGEAAGAATGAAGTAGEAAGTATDAGKTAESAGREAMKEGEKSITDKVKHRNERDRIKKKIREKIENGLGGDEDENREPTDDEIPAELAEMQKQQELNRALGEEPEPMEKLQGELFGWGLL